MGNQAGRGASWRQSCQGQAAEEGQRRDLGAQVSDTARSSSSSCRHGDIDWLSYHSQEVPPMNLSESSIP